MAQLTSFFFLSRSFSLVHSLAHPRVAVAQIKPSCEFTAFFGLREAPWNAEGGHATGGGATQVQQMQQVEQVLPPRTYIHQL